MTDIQKFVQSRGNISQMKKMLDGGIIKDIDIIFDNGLSQNTTLMFESVYGTIEGMKFLLSRNANPNIQDKNGFTALHKIVNLEKSSRGAKAIQMQKIRLLLEYGADKTLRTKNGKTAFELSKCLTCCNSCGNIIQTYRNTKGRKQKTHKRRK